MICAKIRRLCSGEFASAVEDEVVIEETEWHYAGEDEDEAEDTE